MGSLEYAILSKQGSRPYYEDWACVREFPSGIAAAVADGLGGEGGGEAASKAAAQELLCELGPDFGGTQEDFLAAVSRANDAVLACQTNDCHMMTTLAGFYLKEGRALWAHVGDSRIYHFQDGRLISRTLDHSVPQMAVDMGMITAEQIRFHEDRSRILRALGSDSCEPEISEMISVEEGFHAFLLCTDGFWELVLEHEMEEALAHAPDPSRWLSEMEALWERRASQQQDNCTAAAVFTVGGI